MPNTQTAEGVATGTQEIFDNSTITTAPDDPFAGLHNFLITEAQAKTEGTEAKPKTEPEVEASLSEEPRESQTPEPETKTEEVKEPEQHETKETESEETEEAEETEESDAFQELEKGTQEFPDFKALKEKYPRNASDKVLKEAAAYAETAKKYHDFVNELGGETFAEPVKKITTGLRTGNVDGFFTGIHETAGTDALMSVIAGALDLALLRPAQFAQEKDNDAAIAFAGALNAVTETAIKERFGSDIDLKKIERAIDLARQGWVEKIDKWKEDFDDFDYEEVRQLVNLDNDPKAKALLKENAELKAEREAREAMGKANETERRIALESNFSSQAEKDISSAFDGVIWKNSPLKSTDSDDNDISEAKRIMRASIQRDAINAFYNSPEMASLKKDFALGKSGTALWRSAFANAVNAAILQTKAANRAAEQVIVKLRGQTRNGKLATSTTNGKGTASTKPPTASTTPPKTPDASRTDDLSTPASIEQAIFEGLRSRGL